MSAPALTYDQWVAGVEYGNGDRGQRCRALPRLGLNGYQASLGYVLNTNWQITGGWQRLDYAPLQRHCSSMARRASTWMRGSCISICTSRAKRADRGDAGKAGTAAPHCAP